jgi:S1-C subfamily serine protease
MTRKRQARSFLLIFALIAGPTWAEPGFRAAHASADGIDQAKRATVGILQDGADSTYQIGRARFSVRASGFHLHDGYLVTARHAVDKEEGGKRVVPNDITVMTSDLHELPATLVGVSPFVDLAVYRLTGEGTAGLLPAMAFADAEPTPGMEIFTVGYPLGWGPAMSFGRIGNPNTFLPTIESRLLQLDLSACSGNSGGGLFHADGMLAGVVHAIIQTESSQEDRRCSRFVFAVPGPLAKRIVGALIEGAHPQFARIGIQMTVVKVGTRWQVAVGDVSGPAQTGGVRKGDVLLAIDETPITDPAQLKNYLIERTQPGQIVRITVRRGAGEQTFSVTLGKF